VKRQLKDGSSCTRGRKAWAGETEGSAADAGDSQKQVLFTEGDVHCSLSKGLQSSCELGPCDSDRQVVSPQLCGSSNYR